MQIPLLWKDFIVFFCRPRVNSRGFVYEVFRSSLSVVCEKCVMMSFLENFLLNLTYIYFFNQSNYLSKNAMYFVRRPSIHRLYESNCLWFLITELPNFQFINQRSNEGRKLHLTQQDSHHGLMMISRHWTPPTIPPTSVKYR